MRAALPALLAVLALTPVAVRAQTPLAPGASELRPATLTLSAAGEVRLAPDQAVIQLGVTATAPTAQEAVRQQAERMTRVLATLKGAGLSGADVQTTQLSLNPQYVYEQNKPPQLTGYQATNGVVLRVRDLRRLGAAVDAATGAGADSVGGISLQFADASRAEDQARVKAVQALQARARLYAEASGQRIVRLASLSEAGGYQPEPPRPMLRMAMSAKADAVSTPVEGGEVLVRVEVSGVYETAPR